MALDSKRLNEDGDYAAEFFGQFGTDVNAAQHALSEGGATEVNLFQVTLTLAQKVKELQGAGTPEGDKAILENPDTPGSQKDAVQRGVDLEEKAKQETADKTAQERNKKAENEPQKSGILVGSDKQKVENPSATPNQPTSSSGIDLG